MKVKDVIKVLEEDGWDLASSKLSGFAEPARELTTLELIPR